MGGDDGGLASRDAVSRDGEDYDYRSRKTGVLLSSNIDPAIGMNVVGHLALAIGAYGPPGLMGRPVLVDASDVKHVGISRFPVIVLKGRPVKVRRAIAAARERPDLLVVDYPAEMLSTGHDDELAASLSGRREEDLEYFGVAIHGVAASVDEILGRFSLWRLE